MNCYIVQADIADFDRADDCGEQLTVIAPNRGIAMDLAALHPHDRPLVHFEIADEIKGGFSGPALALFWAGISCAA